MYHVEIVKNHGRLTCAVDNSLYLDVTDPTPHTEGLVGFRTFRTDLWFDNLTVTALEGGTTLPWNVRGCVTRSTTM